MARRPQIADLRGQLAVHPDRRFGRRPLEAIRGVVFHQTLGDFSVQGIAKYHVSRVSHISPGVGCPGICYTFFIDTDGAVYQCNDLEAITWSQGGSETPLPATRRNTNFLAVVFRGDFRGRGHKGNNPTEAQLVAGRALWLYLRDLLGLSEDSLFGHHDFGKPACPGTRLSKLIADIRSEGLDILGNLPRTRKGWQRALVRLGHDLGPWGPKKDGVDGQWGEASQAALVAFQKAEGLTPGALDTATSVRLAERLAVLPVVKKPPTRRRARKNKTDSE